MKRFILYILLCLGTTTICFSQESPEHQHRISLGWGILTHEFIDNYLFCFFEDEENCYPGSDDHGRYEYLSDNLCMFPVNLNLHYEYTIGNHFSVGGCLGYNYYAINRRAKIYTSVGDLIDDSGETYTDWEITREKWLVHRHVLHFMAEGNAYWFKKRHVAMYSKMGVGMRFNIEKSMRTDRTQFKETRFYMQVSPVCVEVGGQVCRAFFEFGYGGQGMAQFGAKYTFQGRTQKADTEPTE